MAVEGTRWVLKLGQKKGARTAVCSTCFGAQELGDDIGHGPCVENKLSCEIAGSCPPAISHARCLGWRTRSLFRRLNFTFPLILKTSQSRRNVVPKSSIASIINFRRLPSLFDTFGSRFIVFCSSPGWGQTMIPGWGLPVPQGGGGRKITPGGGAFL